MMLAFPDAGSIVVFFTDHHVAAALPNNIISHELPLLIFTKSLHDRISLNAFVLEVGLKKIDKKL